MPQIECRVNVNDFFTGIDPQVTHIPFPFSISIFMVRTAMVDVEAFSLTRCQVSRWACSWSLSEALPNTAHVMSWLLCSAADAKHRMKKLSAGHQLRVIALASMETSNSFFLNSWCISAKQLTPIQSLCRLHEWHLWMYRYPKCQPPVKVSGCQSSL